MKSRAYDAGRATPRGTLGFEMWASIREEKDGTAALPAGNHTCNIRGTSTLSERRSRFSRSNTNTQTQHSPDSKRPYSKSTTMDIRCQCGTIHLRTSIPTPLALYHCHCLECRAQSASAFGTSAIFPSAGLYPLPESVAANMGLWSRPGGEESGGRRTMDCYFCKVCGVRVFHRIRVEDGDGGEERETVSVKGGLVEGLDWKGGKHIFCRSAVVPIPEGAERWEGSPFD